MPTYIRENKRQQYQAQRSLQQQPQQYWEHCTSGDFGAAAAAAAAAAGAAAAAVAAAALQLTRPFCALCNRNGDH